MPINIAADLPAKEALERENIFVMTEDRAVVQDIRPLRIAIVNLMPTKIATEIQLLRLLGNSPVQVDITLIKAERHVSKNTSAEHLARFYTTFSRVRDSKFDGMIITGAPVEQIDFSEVDYWEELASIMDYSRTHVFSTLHICWGAQAGLWHHFGIKKHPLPEKLFGVFPHLVNERLNPIFRGFDDMFFMPHSRHTEIRREDVAGHPDLLILSESPDAGLCIVKDRQRRQFFITGHMEYDADTLDREYRRDLDRGLNISPPRYYYPQDNPAKAPFVSWRAHANLFFSNWMNFYVYQDTPFEIEAIGTEAAPARLRQSWL
ncbi:homoserine O-succinyltransferase [Desulfovibrio sp. OttesenSCG-928-G11]|nr:homoserine O-succinyltransferase [Desulfovibrio sp. OttesenSCG-928-G11]